MRDPVDLRDLAGADCDASASYYILCRSKWPQEDSLQEPSGHSRKTEWRQEDSADSITGLSDVDNNIEF